MTGVRRLFLPWHRRGLAAALTGAPGPGRARARLTTTVRVRESDTAPVEVPLEPAGPGEVLALAGSEIRRTEPFDGCDHAEPSSFAAVEFVAADLPWRFSPFGSRDGSAAGRQWVPPWLALIVVPLAASTLRSAAPGRSAALSCDASELPDPDELWAWAHVQVTRPDGVPDTDGLDADVADPTRSLSRLLCPRRLEGATAYRACVVPAFAVGRDAALGRKPEGEPLAPAWGAAGAVELPALYTWTFTTGEAGSFETLARRLRPRAIPSSGPRRTVDTSAPGWGLPERPGRGAVVSGALLPADEPPDPNPPDPELAAGLRAALTADAGGDGPVLRPPVYGANQHPGPLPQAGWMAELNADPRHRVAAGLGAWAVVLHQEELVDSAWDQLAAARPATDGPAGDPAAPPADPVVAAAVSGSLAARHVTALDRGGGRARRSRSRRSAGRFRPGAATAAPPPFAPSFPEPAYTYLRAVAPEWLLAGAEALPAETVALARTDPSFVESFLVGMNDALARELLWRRFPVDPDATLLPTFWGAPGGGAPGTSIAGWDPESALGTHGGTAGGQLVLVVRGTVLQRFPGTTIVLSRTAGGAEVERLTPDVAGTLDPGTTFVGFPRTRADVQSPAPDEQWWVVLEEPQHSARFGLDDPGEDPGAGALPDSWQDLSWSHVAAGGEVPRHLRVDALAAGTERPVARTGADVAVWGRDAAHVALATARPPFAVRIPLRLWLPPVDRPV